MKGSYKEAGEAFFIRNCSDRSKRFKLKEGKFSTARVVRHWNRLWGGCGCPIPGSVGGQAGWSSQEHGLMEGSLPTAVELELDDL